MGQGPPPLDTMIPMDTTTEHSVPLDAAALRARRVEKERSLGVDEGDEFAFHHLGWTLLFTLGACAMRCTGLWKRGRANACAVTLERQTIVYPDLPPALEGLEILHLSDFHFSSRDTRHQKAVLAALEGVKADLCLMTGDYRFGHYGSTEHVFPVMEKLLAGLNIRSGIFGVLGNHDSLAVIPGLEALGIRVLMNEGALVQPGETPVWIAGTDDPHKYRADSLALALDGAPENSFRIALVHAPESIPEAASLGVKLYLSGHTHGGQICLPWWGPIRLNARCAREYTVGRWRYGAMEGYTSPGLGNTDLAVRFGAPPLAVLFRLTASKQEEPTP